MSASAQQSATVRSPGQAILRAVGRVVLALAATFVSLAVVESVLRLLDGMPLFELLLPTPYAQTLPPEQSLTALARTLPLADGINPDWIDHFPSPLANRTPPDPAMVELRRKDGGRARLESDLYRQWNARYASALGCKANGGLNLLPLPLAVFDPSIPELQPVYRFPPGVTTPLGLVTNRFGWRGPEIPLDKPGGTVRIAFVGASTTVGAHHYPFSYPEFVGHWLNLWAELTRQPVRFDVINAGREGIGSSTISAIVRQELLPVEPDLVVYYEGANQFRFAPLLDIRVDPPKPVFGVPAGPWQEYTAPIRPYSAFIRAIDHARAVLVAGDGTEPPKPPYRLTWPPNVDEFHPDITSRSLPLQLPAILADLESIRTSLDGIGAELAVSSFVWLVSDGMKIRPRSDALIFQILNNTWWPYRYADMRRMADFQNRVLKRYADLHGLLFVDLAATVPADPELFRDAIHFKREGIRVQAWVAFNAILPRVRERLASAAWPRPDREQASQHPGILPARLMTTCAP